MSQATLLSDAVLPMPARARRLVRGITQAWIQGEAEPDALAFLRRYPELWNVPNAVADLAYEEFHLLDAAGRTPDCETYCMRFAPHHGLVRTMIGVHHLLAPQVHLLDEECWPKPGERVGEFQLLRELGQGKFARVYLAVEPRAGQRTVVLKLSNALTNEARTLGPLEHPNIVPLLSTAQLEKPRLTAVCMAFRGTATLEDLLCRAFPRNDSKPPRSAAVILRAARFKAWPDDPVPGERWPDPRLPHSSYTDAVLHLGTQLASALAYCHERKICHRDLKPSNVLLSPDGRPLLIDFNLSTTPQALTKCAGGTLPYMAPEQIRASRDSDPAAPLDGRADLFALGVVLYELLTGALPFGRLPEAASGAAVANQLLKRQQQPPFPLRRLNPHVSRSEARLIERCLAFDPEERPATAAEVAQELRSYFTPSARCARWARRHAVAFACAAGALLLTTIGSAWFLATRAPAAVRQLRQAEAALAREDAVEAVAHFSLALASDPGRAETWLARGRARLQWSESATGEAATLLENAFADFRQARMLDERTALSARAALQQHGQLAYQQGDYLLAEQCGTVALEMEDTAAVWFDRGRSRLRQAEALTDRAAFLKWTEAATDFNEASQRQPGAGAPLACQAYCLSRLGQYETAILLYGQALERDFPPARLLSNRARCFLLSTSRPDPWDKSGRARADLDTALSCEPRPRAAYYCRGTLILRQWLKNPEQPLDATALSDLEQAIKLGPPNAELFERTALAAAATAAQASLAEWDACKQKALDHLSQAIAHGKDPHHLGQDALLKGLIAVEEFAALSQQPVQAKTRASDPLLWVDPIEE